MSEKPVVSPVYDRAAGPAHLIEGNAHPGSSSRALCGATPPWPNYWFGAGTIHERVHATGLKVCIDCTTQWEAMG